MLELVDNGCNGILVPPGDEHALASSLLAVMQDETRASELGAAARQSIERRYSFDRMVAGFTDLYLTELAVRAGAERALLAS